MTVERRFKMRKELMWAWLKDIDEKISLDEILREVEESERVEEEPIYFGSYQEMKRSWRYAI